MKITETTASDERLVLTGMVLCEPVLARVAGCWHPGLFRSRWANLIAGWCVQYHKEYGGVPGRGIETLYDAWLAAASPDQELASLVDDYLNYLSDEYAEAGIDLNPEYLVDQAAVFLNRVRLEQLAESVSRKAQAGDVDGALADVGAWNRVDFGTGAGIDVLQDSETLKALLDQGPVTPLITYPGALGEFFGNQLARDEFVALIGATGKGKTWWLVDMAWQAIRSGKKVAFFEVGDMSQDQILRRFVTRLLRRPMKAPYRVEIPVDLRRESDLVLVDTETQEWPGPPAWGDIEDALAKATRRHKSPLLRLSVHPNSSITVAGIRGILDEWERAGWIPDVVVIDYADILASPPGFLPGERDGVNETWKQLRRLSQEKHILVLTATQGDANSYDAHIIRRRNFSDDRRKNDHVTGLFGLNATEEEQAQGLARLNWLKRREEAYTESRCVTVAGCLSVGCTSIRSIF